MLSVNNQRRPSVGTNVTSSMGVRRPSDGNVQPIINNMNDSTSNNGQKKNPTSPILTGKPSNGHFPITEPRSRSSSVSSMHSSGSYLLQDMPGVYSQLGLLPTSSLQRQNIFPAEIDTDLITNEATSSGRHHSPPSPVSANADGSNVSSPTSAAASLTRRDHITGHTHDRSRSASFDGEIEPSAWTLDRVLEWLDDNSFSEYKTMFIENNLCGEQFFALGKFKTIKNIVESGDSNRYRLINAIRKIGDVRPKRQSFSNKGNQPDVQSPHSGGQLSLSNSINEQNSPTTPTIQSVPSPTEQISKQKSLKLSTSFPDLRSVKGPITSPVIGPRHSSIGWQTKSNNSSNSTIISSIKETDSSNENTAALPMNNNDKWAKSSVHNNPSVIQKQTSEDITSPLSPNSNRKTKGGPNSSLKIHGETTKNIQVTFDNKTFRVIDLGGREDPSTIKETIFSQLEIPQIEREHCSFHLTEIGQKEIGPTIDDETLIQKCKKADVRGSLKLLIMRKQLSDPYYGQIHNQGKIISGGDQSNKSKILRRTTPPEMSPPHVSPESNHSLPFNNNNDERKYYNITGGSNPIILERWKAEGLSHLTEESQDFSKFREPKDVAYQISHAYSSDHKTHYRTPPNSNHRRHDRENLNYSNSSSPQHRVGDVDYSLNNAPLKSRSQLPPSSKHPVVLQPANGMMNTRRPPSRESIIRNPDNNNRSPPPPPIPPKPNIVTQKSLMSIHGMYMNHNSISQPHLPLPQNLSTNNQESEHYQRPIHAMVSEPDLPLREPQLFSQPGKEFNRHIVQGSTKALFPDDDDEPPLWPKITLSSQSKKEEESFWAEEPKPSTQNAISSFNDEDSLWAETAESFKDKNTSNEGSSWKESSKPSQTDNLSHINDELPPRTSSLINSIDPLRKSLDKTSIEDDENVPIPPKSLSYTSEDSEGDEDFWAQEPISSESNSEEKNKEVAAAAEDPRPQNQKSPPNSGQSTNSLIMRNDETTDLTKSFSSDNRNNNLPDNINDNDNKERDVESMKSNDVINETGNSNSISPSEGIQSNNKSASPTQKPKNGLARTVSLRRGVTESWVVRPTAEDLFEQLEQYFPGHDLDKPIVDSVQQPNINEESPSAPTVKTGGKIQRGKSIRAAAREAHEREQREKKERKERTKKLAVGVVSAIEAFSDAIRVPQKLTRKPTTKLWDKKIVLVPSHKKPCPPEVPPGECVSTEREPVISWAKGELIGKGTFGKVFLAMNVNSSEIMAVKQIELPKTKSDRLNERQQNLVKSFTDEMEILKDLDHEHIVQYIGFEKTDEAINIFLEYVNGGSIGTCLRIYGAFKEPVVRSFTRQILLGLQYLHNRGILHRDIKADNILVDEEGYCKISDFGISKKSEHLAYDHSSNMSLQGTIFWMAPEVFNSTKGYSAKVDIWSLGCVVLEMFAGERPWNNLTDLAAMFKLGSEKKAPPIREDIIMSSDARNFLDQCFIIEPNNRPTAEQLLQHPFAQENPNFHFKEYISIPGRT